MLCVINIIYIEREREREIDQGDVGSNPAHGNYSFPQKLSSVEFPVTLYIYIDYFMVGE